MTYYQVAIKRAALADAKFQRQLNRQFGESDACDMRYQSNKHDELTAAARKEFERASAFAGALAGFDLS